MQLVALTDPTAGRRGKARSRLAPLVATLALAPALLSGGRATAAGNPFGAASPRIFGPVAHSEGIAADSHGNLFLDPVSLTIGPKGLSLPKVGTIEKVSPTGKVLDTIMVPAGSSGASLLTGMLYVPGTGLYVTDGANSFSNPKSTAGRLLLVDPASHAVKIVASGFNSPNNLAMDRKKNLYIGDLGTGTIYKITPSYVLTQWAKDPLLGSIKGAPGVDGIAFDPQQKNLYATNPGGHELVRIPVNANGTAGKPVVFASGAQIDAAQHATLALNGPDGLQIDQQGNIWVAVSWVNQIQVISPAGKLVARYGSKGTAKLYNPCSLVFVGKTLYFSNLSLGIQPSGQLAMGKPYPPGRIGAIQAPYPGLPLAF